MAGCPQPSEGVAEPARRRRHRGTATRGLLAGWLANGRFRARYRQGQQPVHHTWWLAVRMSTRARGSLALLQIHPALERGRCGAAGLLNRLRCGIVVPK